MRTLKGLSVLLIVFVLNLNFLFSSASRVYAATSPDLKQADTFAILSSTYTNTVSGTTINGDLGYTTGPAVNPTVNGTTHIADSTYNQAGIDQGSALSDLNGQACTFTFAPGAIDLATDSTHGTIGVYTPGKYCISGAASIGAAGITLSGSGTYIFKMTGALTTVTGSTVTLTNGASGCDLFWTPGAATTLAANTTFRGTNIDDSGITIGSTVTWFGKALSFGGTISTDTDTITTAACGTTATTSSSSSSGTSSTSGGGSSTGVPASPCPTLAPTIQDPLIIEARRVSPTSVFVSWGPYTGTNFFNVRYGPSNGNWLYNVDVTGFSTTINNLPANQSMWFQVAARNSCSIGDYGEAKLAGGPGLPNTGNIPTQTNNSWKYTTSALAIVSTLLLIVQRKQKDSISN